MKTQPRMSSLFLLLILSILAQCHGKSSSKDIVKGKSDDGTYDYIGIIIAGLLGVLAFVLNGQEAETGE